VKAGADTVQVFDSWAGALSPRDFKTFAQPYLFQIAAALKDYAPVILFPKGTLHAITDLAGSGASGIGLDWCIDPKQARAFAGNNITLQGNFDPAGLLAPIPEIRKSVKTMIDGLARNAILPTSVMV
jgi:uroporphyrinogen decarboxylase